MERNQWFWAYYGYFSQFWPVFFWYRIAYVDASNVLTCSVFGVFSLNFVLRRTLYYWFILPNCCLFHTFWRRRSIAVWHLGYDMILRFQDLCCPIILMCTFLTILILLLLVFILYYCNHCCCLNIISNIL